MARSVFQWQRDRRALPILTRRFVAEFTLGIGQMCHICNTYQHDGITGRHAVTLTRDEPSL